MTDTFTDQQVDAFLCEHDFIMIYVPGDGLHMSCVACHYQPQKLHDSVCKTFNIDKKPE